MSQVEEPILFDRTPGGGAALVPAVASASPQNRCTGAQPEAGMPSEVVAAQARRVPMRAAGCAFRLQAKRGVSAKRWPKRELLRLSDHI